MTTEQVKESDGTSIENLRLSVRASNCLQGAGIRTVEEASLLTREYLLSRTNLGTTTADEILNAVDMWSTRNPKDAEKALASRPKNDPIRNLIESCSDRTFAIWAMRRGLRTGTRMSNRAAGEHFGITSEATRRLIKRHENRLTATFLCENGHQAYESAKRVRSETGPVQFSFSWQRLRSLVEKDLRKNLPHLRDLEPKYFEQYMDVVLATAGDFKLVKRPTKRGASESENYDLWSVPFLKEGMPRLQNKIRSSTHLFENIYSIEDVHHLVEESGVDYFCQNEFIKDHLYLYEAFGGYISKRLSFTKLLTLFLEILAKPATALEISEGLAIGRSEKSIANFLSAGDTFVRTGRKTFGLKKWGSETYEGISEEIAQRIERSGGSTRVAPLIEELHRKFDVAKSSVESYLQTPRFKVTSGLARLRSPEELKNVEPDLSLQPGWWWLSTEVVRARLEINSERLRGSGLPVSKFIASALGVQFGEDSIFTVAAGGTVTVNWATSQIGPQVGSLKGPIEKAGLNKGEHAFFDFNLMEETLEILPSSTGAKTRLDNVQQMLGIRAPDSTDLVSLFSNALGVKRDIRTVLDCLYRRKESSLGDLVERKGEPGVWPSRKEIYSHLISFLPSAKIKRPLNENPADCLHLALGNPLFRDLRIHCFTLGFERLTREGVSQKGLRVTLPAKEPIGSNSTAGEFLLMGYDPSWDVFVLWDSGIHHGPSTYSPHELVWTGEWFMRQAIGNSDGVAIQGSPTGEVIVACKARALEAGMKRRFSENLKRLIGN